MQNLKMNKKGFLIELLALIVVGIVVLIFFALWKYGINLVNTELLNFPSENNATNITDVTQKTFGYYNSALDQLSILGFLIIFGFAMATLITAYFSRQHPIIMFVYFMILVILIIFSIYVSNSYEDLLNNEILGSTLTSFSVGNHIMLHLPLWIGVIGFIGIFLMLGGIIIDRDFR